MASNKHDQFLYWTALELSSLSTCSRQHVGALLVRDRRIISTGYNGAPSGMEHCFHAPGDERPCEKAVHAEANTIAFAAKHGVSTEGSTLWTTLSPCYTCSALIINSGIKNVRYIDEYRSLRGLDLLAQAGVGFTRVVQSEL